MDLRAPVVAIVCAVLVSFGSTEKRGVIAPWLPVKDVLVTVPASSAGPSATYLHILYPEVGRGRRLPAIFLVKNLREEEVVAYLTGIGGDLGAELLSVISKGDKVVREYLTDQLSPKPPPALEKSSSAPRPPLPSPFDYLPLTRVVLPSTYLTLSDFAKFPASRFDTPTKTMSFILVAERSELFS